jgi:leucine dehydrogenase
LGQKRQNEDNMGLKFKEIPVKGYERVVKISDEDSGLEAIIAIHDTTLGPALGGTRIFPYAHFDDALKDVLRLSRGMTYKSAIVESGFGGGKSVIIADPHTQKDEAKLRAFGKAINRFKGTYICAEDVGCTLDDVLTIREETPYVTGLPFPKSSGNPCRFTAWGTFCGIKAASMRLFGSSDLKGKKVAIQGLGSVGMVLVDFLFWAGAELFVSDIDKKKAKEVALRYGATSVHSDEILFVECDVLVPCAMGGIINDETLPKLRCKALAGCANNQLEKESQADDLRARGILYAPDFVINAGGVLNASFEFDQEGYRPIEARKRTDAIFDKLLTIFDIAEKSNCSTLTAAMQLADYRIKYGIGKRIREPYFHPIEDLV